MENTWEGGGKSLDNVRKYSNLTPILLVHPRDPKRCPKRPQELPCPLNIHLGSHKMCFEPVSTRHVTMGCVSPRARAHIGPPRLESMPGHPRGRQTRGRAFGAPLLLGVQRPNHGCRVSTKAPCARPQGERALTNPGQQVEPAARPEVGGPIGPQIPPSGPGPCPFTTFHICDTEVCQLVKSLLYRTGSQPPRGKGRGWSGG